MIYAKIEPENNRIGNELLFIGDNEIGWGEKYWKWVPDNVIDYDEKHNPQVYDWFVKRFLAEEGFIPVSETFFYKK